MVEEKYSIEFFDLGRDEEGPLQATFISSKRNASRPRAVLYLHGFLDYFFHDHLCDYFVEQKYDFYALELRRYGRNLKTYQSPNKCISILEYYEEITLALRRIEANRSNDITFLGHSLGGLIAVNYAQNGVDRKAIKRLILNAPFFDFQVPRIQKILMPPLLKLLSIFTSKGSLNEGVNPLYPMTIHKDFHGEWDFNLKMKPIEGFPVYFSWLLAINSAKNNVRDNVTLDIPVLILHSDKSIVPKKWGEELKYADTVLNVEDMKSVGKLIGNDVTLEEIKGALHDTFLSSPEVVQSAFNKMQNWLELKNTKSNV